MEKIGAQIIIIEPIELNFSGDLSQQNGYLHARIVTTIVDSACGFAAYSLMPQNSGVLTVEYKVYFLSPARGEKFIATSRVAKVGKTLTDCAGEVTGIDGGKSKQIAMMQATMIRMAEGDSR